MLHCVIAGTAFAGRKGVRIGRCNLWGPRGIPRGTPGNQVTPMNRTMLALSLALFAAGAIAAEPPQADAEPATCPKSEAAEAKAPARSDAANASTAGNPAPVRSRGGANRAPRWNNLLPGMFR